MPNDLYEQVKHLLGRPGCPVKSSCGRLYANLDGPLLGVSDATAAALIRDWLVRSLAELGLGPMLFRHHGALNYWKVSIAGESIKGEVMECEADDLLSALIAADAATQGAQPGSLEAP